MHAICVEIEEIVALCREITLLKDAEAAAAMREAVSLLEQANRLLKAENNPRLRLVTSDAERRARFG